MRSLIVSSHVVNSCGNLHQQLLHPRILLMWVSLKGAWPAQRADNESESRERELAGRDRLVAPPRVEDERGRPRLSAPRL